MNKATAPPLVLVTGASGYIATHVVQQLQEQGYRVRGTVRSLQNATKVEPLRQLCPTAKYPIELVEADLLKANSWAAAIKDCQYVMHVASPLPARNPRNEDEVIKPAVNGTMAILRACHAVRTVKRVVLTSAFGTIHSGYDVKEDHVYTEADWADIQGLRWVYMKSKILAERAAWDYHARLPASNRFELAVLNPGYVIGPVLCGSAVTSMEFPRRMLQNEIPIIPPISFPCVDVRDVAAAHVAAMVIPEAAGHRHIIATNNMWLADIARILEQEFKSQGYDVPTSEADMDRPSVIKFDNSRMKNVLGVVARDIRDSLVDMAYSMIEGGFVKRSSKYTGPGQRQSARL